MSKKEQYFLDNINTIVSSVFVDCKVDIAKVCECTEITITGLVSFSKLNEFEHVAKVNFLVVGESPIMENGIREHRIKLVMPIA